MITELVGTSSCGPIWKKKVKKELVKVTGERLSIYLRILTTSTKQENLALEKQKL